mmetsp:Transcript_23038/g.34309  ORF Transcript_23038/g.34309 Transcript_23038/m.34309 type:complete len:117 (+) Transcript_23038:556-906(+)
MVKNILNDIRNEHNRPQIKRHIQRPNPHQQRRIPLPLIHVRVVHNQLPHPQHRRTKERRAVGCQTRRLRKGRLEGKFNVRDGNLRTVERFAEFMFDESLDEALDYAQAVGEGVEER